MPVSAPPEDQKTPKVPPLSERGDGGPAVYTQKGAAELEQGDPRDPGPQHTARIASEMFSYKTPQGAS